MYCEPSEHSKALAGKFHSEFEKGSRDCFVDSGGHCLGSSGRCFPEKDGANRGLLPELLCFAAFRGSWNFGTSRYRLKFGEKRRR